MPGLSLCSNKTFDDFLLEDGLMLRVDFGSVSLCELSFIVNFEHGATGASSGHVCRGFANVGEQMSGLTTTMGAQGVAKIKPFEGNPKEFKDWIKGIEKYAILTRITPENIRMIAYQASKGPVSDFLKRHLAAHPDHDWNTIKTELTSRFAEVTDHQYALSLLRKVKQRQGESIQVYAERLLALAEDAFNDVAAADEQLVGFFVDGLSQDYMKM